MQHGGSTRSPESRVPIRHGGDYCTFLAFAIVPIRLRNDLEHICVNLLSSAVNRCEKHAGPMPLSLWFPCTVLYVGCTSYLSAPRAMRSNTRSLTDTGLREIYSG